MHRPRRSMTLSLLSIAILAPFSRAAVKTQAVNYDAGGAKCVGYLAYDDSTPGKRPGVLVVPEWWGLNDYPKMRAEKLAALGYVAFVADMYGNGDSTADPKIAAEKMTAILSNPELEKNRAAAALEQLRKNENVDPANVAAIGYCFGGGVVLDLARAGADLKGVVAFHAGHLAAKSADDVKNIKCKVLVAHGGADAFVKPEDFDAFVKQMNDAKIDWQLDIYGGAVHAFTNPNADKANLPGVAYNKPADERSWDAMKRFFAELFN